MKKHIAALLLLLLFISCPAYADENVIVNKMDDIPDDFAFAQDAALLEIYFPIVYGCDAAVVRYGETTMLIDCAGNQHPSVSKMLKKLGISQLTYAFNSHPDSDHIGGFNTVLRAVPAGEFLMGFPQDYPHGDDVRFKVYDALHKMDIPMRQVAHGDAIAFGDVQMTVYQRTDEHLPRVNSKSATLYIRYGDRTIFFTGDIMGDAQYLLAQDETIELDADILKYPHHGYEPLRPEFLARTSPQWVIATCGKSGSAGQKQMAEHDVPFVMTATKGLRLATDGSTWTIERFAY